MHSGRGEHDGACCGSSKKKLSSDRRDTNNCLRSGRNYMAEAGVVRVSDARKVLYGNKDHRAQTSSAATFVASGLRKRLRR
jgi:hypothetical protein